MTTVFEQANADGRALAARHDWTSAEQAFRRAASHAEQAGDDAQAAVALANLGHALYHRGALVDAESALRRSVEHRESLASRGEPAGLAQALNDLAVVVSAAARDAGALADDAARLFDGAMAHAALGAAEDADAIARNAARALIAAGDLTAAEPIVARLAESAPLDESAAWDDALAALRSASPALALLVNAPAHEPAFEAAHDPIDATDAPTSDDGLVFLPIDDAGDEAADAVVEIPTLLDASDDATDEADDVPMLASIELAPMLDDEGAGEGADEAPALPMLAMGDETDVVADAFDLAPASAPLDVEEPLAFAEALALPEPLAITDVLGAASEIEFGTLLELAADDHESTTAESIEPLPAIESMPVMASMVESIELDAERDGDEQAAESAAAPRDERAEPRRKGGRKRRGRDTRPRSTPAIAPTRTPASRASEAPVPAPQPMDAGAGAGDLEWVAASASQQTPRVRQTTGDFAALFETPEYASLTRSVTQHVEWPESDETAETAETAETGVAAATEEAHALHASVADAGDVAATDVADLHVADWEPAASGALVRAVETEPAGASPDWTARERSLTPPTSMTAPTRRPWWRRLGIFGKD